jgi:glycosyltransferase involved in cell wall biosynthesis/sulfatase maturation enzyme AslB (radical SAM superfamily)
MSISISFVIPTYNRSKTLKKSILDYLNVLNCISNLCFEIILVNDGSIDNTFFIVSELERCNKEVVAINLPKNEGPGVARNFGIDVARYDYVWFLDDDDQLNQDGVSKIIDLIINSIKDESLVYAHSLQKKYAISLVSGTRKKQVLKNIILFKEKQEVFNYIFNRTFLLKNNIKFSSGVHEDISFIVKALSIADRIEILDLQVYRKLLHDDSITYAMNLMRIDGYLNAYFNVLNFNDEHTYFDDIDIKEFTAQIFGIVCYLIVTNSKDSGHIFLDYFISRLKKLGIVKFLPSNFIESDSNLKYAVSTLFHGVQDELSVEEIFENLSDIFNSHLSCKDLNSSIFLGPNEIRACCKRFFVNGRQKGDVVLLPASPDIHLEEINLAKEKLINEINREESAVCSGCPYIERVKKRFDNYKIDYISLENFSYCNMRCKYCSPKYYDGTEAIYGANNIISELADSNKLSDDCHIVWGGGEPTLSPTFGNITELLLKNIGVGKVRILSNSLKFSKKLSSFLTDSRVHLVTSIDAGKQETFKEIRGKGDIDAVLTNLALYLNGVQDKSRITIKYIFTTENFESEELQAFVEKISFHNLISPLFQISCDFRVENPGIEVIFGFYELVSRLHKIGIKYVFFDDLIRDRLDLTPHIADSVISYLNSKDLPIDRIYSYSSNSKVVLWGKGLQSNWYIQNTSYGKAGNVIAQISSSCDVDLLDHSKINIMPSGIQSMYEILKNIESSPVRARLVCPVLL